MTTKMYKAFVKSKETGEFTIIESEYTSKKDFARDLRANGYAVKFISTPEKFDEDSEKFDEDSENYNWELKRRKNVREAMKQHKANKEQEVQETVEQTTEVETKTEEMAETEEYDSGFEYYSVETAYEVDFRDRQNEVFKAYSEAEKTAGDNIILEVDLIVRNDKKAVSEHDKEVFEDETDEIECRCIWYHHNGVKGMIAQDTKRVIKKPETAEIERRRVPYHDWGLSGYVSIEDRQDIA